MKAAPAETAPGIDETSQAASQVPCFALVLLWSASENHRAGQVAFFPAFQTRFVGRGDSERDVFAHFAEQRPGQPMPLPTSDTFLSGDSISRRQLRVTATAVGLEIEKVGRCTTLVNEVETSRACLGVNDTVMLRGEALFLCVRRNRMIPALEDGCLLQPFGEPDGGGSVGESPGSWDVRKGVHAAAAVNEHVLVRGETGTGKEAVSRSIHLASARASRPLVPVNAAVFTDTLVESKIFGNVAHYPNPGTPARKGFFAEADKSTLFLDEIGECPLPIQAQFLRPLASGEYQPLGESMPRRADVRVVGATWRDDDVFRVDFLQRFPLHVRIPPLRERREDIPLLIRHLLIAHAAERPKLARFLQEGPGGALYPRISGRFVEYLVRHELVGNVRKLSKILVAAAMDSEGDTIEMPSLDGARPPASARSANGTTEPKEPNPPKSKRREGAQPTKEELVAALERAGGSVDVAAKALGLPRSTAYALVTKYEIKRRERTFP